ncbi:hypothetical protein SAMN04487867_10854 [Vreelandella titanicae]|uniref:hypothetical protein n=1 Tax=Vreelandella titanicae TaxID=664683 RepID=UPI000887267A|nr:hypothetical protein [Halomonas titanicae]SDI51754.1 hypothetical protein SAMN04487867_10854 [Halomonas titanicae]
MQNLDWMTKKLSTAQTSPVAMPGAVENYSDQECFNMNDFHVGLPEASQINYATSTSDFIAEGSYFCIG